MSIHQYDSEFSLLVHAQSQLEVFRSCLRWYWWCWPRQGTAACRAPPGGHIGSVECPSSTRYCEYHLTSGSVVMKCSTNSKMVRLSCPISTYHTQQTFLLTLRRWWGTLTSPARRAEGDRRCSVCAAGTSAMTTTWPSLRPTSPPAWPPLGSWPASPPFWSPSTSDYT